MNTRLASLLALPLLLGPAVARAECRLEPFAFFPDRNDTVHARGVTDDQSFCDNSFREGPGYKFTSVTLVKPPPHGIVATLGPGHFEYHALPGYKGRDQYTIRACATVGARESMGALARSRRQCPALLRGVDATRTRRTRAHSLPHAARAIEERDRVMACA